MKRILLLILSLIILSASIVADEPERGEIDEIRRILNDIQSGVVVEIMPDTGAYGVNMRDSRYPEREAGTNLEYKNIDIDTLSPSSDDFRTIYVPEQMVLLAGVENVPTESSLITYRREDTTDHPYIGEDVPAFRIIFEDDPRNESGMSSVDIDIRSSTDYMYVSQSNPIYQRPYKLYASPRYNFSDGTVDNQDKTHHSGESIEFYNDHISDNIDFRPKEAGGYSHMNIWFDLILALPYDSYNESGVLWDNKEFPLADSNDYSSVVTITIRWEQEYRIEYNEGNWESVEWAAWRYCYDSPRWVDYTTKLGVSGVLRVEKTLSIPFSGFSSTIESGPLDDTGSLVITPYPAASNLSLDAEDTGGDAIPVAEIQFIMTYGSTNYVLNPSTSNTWIFLSASPDPYASNPNGFMLVHDEAGSILTSYNSTPYTVTVTGITANSDGAGGDEVVFDGKEKAADFYLNQTGPDSYIHTEPNYNLELPHTHGKYSHYSEYEGIVSVQIPRTPVAADGMRAGRYTSEIYIHVMTEE